jgi:hypothetical protein
MGSRNLAGASNRRARLRLRQARRRRSGERFTSRHHLEEIVSAATGDSRRAPREHTG